jgi:hypothetical protein
MNDVSVHTPVDNPPRLLSVNGESLGTGKAPGGAGQGITLQVVP